MRSLAIEPRAPAPPKTSALTCARRVMRCARYVHVYIAPLHAHRGGVSGGVYQREGPFLRFERKRKLETIKEPLHTSTSFNNLLTAVGVLSAVDRILAENLCFGGPDQYIYFGALAQHVRRYGGSPQDQGEICA